MFWGLACHKTLTWLLLHHIHANLCIHSLLAGSFYPSLAICAKPPPCYFLADLQVSWKWCPYLFCSDLCHACISNPEVDPRCLWFGMFVVCKQRTPAIHRVFFFSEESMWLQVSRLMHIWTSFLFGVSHTSLPNTHVNALWRTYIFFCRSASWSLIAEIPTCICHHYVKAHNPRPAEHCVCAGEVFSSKCKRFLFDCKTRHLMKAVVGVDIPVFLLRSEILSWSLQCVLVLHRISCCRSHVDAIVIW